MRLSTSHILLLTSSRSIYTTRAFIHQGGALTLRGDRKKISKPFNFKNRNFSERLMVAQDTPSHSLTKIGLLQFKVSSSKAENHKKVREFIAKAVQEGARLLVLPEIWNGPYATSAFASYAEVLPPVNFKYSDKDSDRLSNECPSAKILFESATQNKVFIIGGSIAEKEDTNIFNTCLCISPDGVLIGKHRKVHLFDIDVPGGIRFKESDTLSPGNVMTSFNAGEFGPVGVGICYDIRFPEYAMLLTQKYKCNLLIYPGAFNMTTGPAHWELLQRARAVDNQCFVLTASPARTQAPFEEREHKHYTAWGHSSVVNPWGEVIGTCGHDEDIVVVDLNLDEVKQMREGIPTFTQKRHDMYRLSDGSLPSQTLS